MKILTICPNCSSRKLKFLFESRDRMFNLPGRFQVYQCISCGVLFIANPPTSHTIGKYYPSNTYYSYRNQDDDGFFGKLRNYLLVHYYQPTIFTRLLTMVIPNVPAIPEFKLNGKILDIGCGSGDTLVSLGNLGWDTTGIDIDKYAIKIAKDHGVHHAYVGTYKVLKRFPDNYFDVIRMYHVIEHLYEPGDCLHLIKKKLKPDGELIIGTPNNTSVVARLFGKYWYNLDTPRHLVIFNPSILIKLLNDMDFMNIKLEFCSAGGILGSIGYLFRNYAETNMSLLDKQWLVVMTYPIEWLLDKLSAGDIFVLRCKRSIF